MNKLRFASLVIFILSSFLVCHAQTKNQPALQKNVETRQLNPVKTSPAYAEVLLRKTELLSELEGLLIEYTEDFPKVKEMRFETVLLQKELDRLLAANVPDASRLSAALGKLMVRKCELSVDLWVLQQQFNDQHPDVKRAKRKSEIFETAINDILQGK